MENITGEVFISYAREDAEVARKLYKELKKNSISAWLDKEDLLPGMNWEHEIQYQIRKSSHFIALMSKNSVNKKGYVQKELKQGLEILREYPENEVYLIPVRIDDSVPQSFELQKIHWVDLLDDWDSSIRKIIKVVSLRNDDQGKIRVSEKKEKIKILIVDDEEMILILLKELLELEGYKVHTLKDPHAAADYFKKISPDITILDINMPDLNGIELLRRLKKISLNSPVFLYSAYKEYMEDFGSWAAEEFIVKSSNFDELKQAIRKYV